MSPSTNPKRDPKRDTNRDPTQPTHPKTHPTSKPSGGSPAICRHCGKSKVNRPRGLCWSCYYTPGVKEQYPSTSKYARRGVGNFTGTAPLPPEPTTAPPGSPEKIAVLAERARRKQALFHPDDARYEGDPRPLQHRSPDTKTSPRAA